MCCESAACDAVRDLFEAGIRVQHFGWGSLLVVSSKVQGTTEICEGFCGLTFENWQLLKKGVIRTSPML